MKKTIGVKKAIPHDFVLELLDEMEPYTKPMFGCTAVYVGSKIVFILRDRGNSPPDDGVWIATTGEHHASLRRDLPSMRDIEIFGPGPTGWQVLPVSADDFEESVRLACEFVLNGDERIGKVPKARVSRSKKKAGSQKRPAQQTPKSSKKKKR